MRTLSVIEPLQVEQLFQGLEQAVAPARSGRLFEGDGGSMQELVEQRVAQVLDLLPVLRAQVCEPAQRALQLRRAHLLQPVADLLEHRDDGQPRSEERRVGKECRSRWSP